MSTSHPHQGLIKRYGRVRALDGLDLHGRKGQIHGFLGPNGAGKSTTIRGCWGSRARRRRGPSSAASVARRRRPAPAHRLRARRRQRVAQPLGRRGDRPAGAPARRRAPRQAYRAEKERPCEAFHFDRARRAARLEGLPAEGRLIAAFAVPADLTSSTSRRAASTRSWRPCSAGDRAGARRRRDRAAVDPHPVGGRAAVRSRLDHPRRPHRRVGVRRHRRERTTRPLVVHEAPGAVDGVDDDDPLGARRGRGVRAGPRTRPRRRPSAARTTRPGRRR